MTTIRFSSRLSVVTASAVLVTLLATAAQGCPAHTSDHAHHAHSR